MTLKKNFGPKYLSFLVHSLWISFILPILLTSTVFTKYRSSFKFNQPLHAINYVNRASNQIEDSHSSIQWLDLPSKSTNTAVLKKAHVYSDIYYNFSFVNNDEEQEDNDKDGYDESTDCDDNNYCINPGVVEVCNGIDDNCNGQIDEGLDVDEVCNGLDDNCNGEIDEGYNKRPFYPDQDRDGYGDKNSDSRSIIQACATESVFFNNCLYYVIDNTDCNDFNQDINPGEVEVCNGIDDNCNGQIDETNIYYRDFDQDGYGDNSNPTPGCETQTPPTGYVADNTDCNDNNANVSPGTLEFCNGIDDDCDGKSDEECLTSKPPIVSISILESIVEYSTPARIKINASATDPDGTITKVKFYNGTTLLHTETAFPYGFLWINVPVGNYKLTAKATDNTGGVTTSNIITVSVVEGNVAPVVSIVSPVDDITYYNSPATIPLIAIAKDPNDKISKVEFYNGTSLIRTENYYPYRYTLYNVQPGTYTITAKATDDKGLSATSAPITVIVSAPPIVPIVRSSRPSFTINNKTNIRVKVSPNPAYNILQIYTNKLQLNKPATISIISASGVVEKTIYTPSNQIMQMDVSFLKSGVYFLKVLSGDEVLHTQFVKL